MNFDSIDLTIKGSVLFIIPLILSAIAYTVFIYRYTIPATSVLMKSVLVFLRSSILILLLLLLFEPVLNIYYLKSINPVNLFFIDNSSSIVHKDSLKTVLKINELLDKINKESIGKNHLYTFGKETKKITPQTQLTFNEPITNFEKIIPVLQKEKNISSVTIISDGIINEGSNSYNYFEKFHAPIFTVAVGDTTEPKDVLISNANFNRFIYKDKITEIVASVVNYNLNGKKVFVKLHDGNSVIAQQTVKLSNSGINKVRFNYTPYSTGKKILSLSVSEISGESTFENNKYTFALNIINDKIKVFLFAGAASGDLSSLIKSIQRDNKYELKKFISLSDKNRINFNKIEIDSADIFVFIDFPSTVTTNSEIKSIVNQISAKNTPSFFFLTQSTDYQKLKRMGKIIPFQIIQITNDFLQITPNIISNKTPLISNQEIWEEFPPLFSNFSELEPIVGSNLIATGKTLNRKLEIPFIFSSKIANRRVVVFNGFNFWRWRLNGEVSFQTAFDGFISNSLKWLYANGINNNITFAPSKNVYASGETIAFSASVYDESLTPRNDADITVEIKPDNLTLPMVNNGNGNYTGKLNLLNPGSYLYQSTVNIPGETQHIFKGKLEITKQNLENIDFVLNNKYLNFISNITSGKSFDIENYNSLIGKINFLAKRNKRFSKEKETFNFVGNQWILIIIVILFATEWYFRKRKQML